MPTARRSLPPIVQRSALTYHADLRPHGCARHRAQTSAPRPYASGGRLRRHGPAGHGVPRNHAQTLSPVSRAPVQAPGGGVDDLGIRGFHRSCS